MDVMVVDDMVFPVQKTLDAFLQRRRNEFRFIPVMHPKGIERALEENPGVKAVLLDMDFSIRKRKDDDPPNCSGLTALDFLSDKDRPPVIGFSKPEGSKPLFRYASCQLVRRPPVEWVPKDPNQYPRLFQVLDTINRGEEIGEVESLKGCYADGSASGVFMGEILEKRFDTAMWRGLASAGSDYEELATMAAINTRSAIRRVEYYYHSLVRFEAATADVGENIVDASEMEGHWNPEEKMNSDVEAFAVRNASFFTAGDLEEMVRKRDDRVSSSERGRLWQREQEPSSSPEKKRKDGRYSLRRWFFF